ncbi:MAG: extracellular solute-binding protein [Anaerolineae bacterium]|nr:extracellular solute-binding protein [Anaerolineae bacterium]
MLILIVMLLAACSTPATPTSPPLIPSQTLQTAPTQAGEATAPPIETLPPTDTPIPPTPTDIPVTLLGLEPGQLNGATVQFWHSFSGARERLLIEWAETFNASNTFGIAVQLTNQDSLFNAVQDALRAGNPPSLTISFANQASSWDLASSPPGEGLVNLDPYVTDPVYGYAPDEIADFYPNFLAQETMNGKMIGFPTYRSAQVLFYNVSWAQALGFQSPPVTPDEFKQQACAANQAMGDGTGGWFINTDTATTLSWIFAFGGKSYRLRACTHSTPRK